MILKKIILHPFAGTRQRTFTFSKGLNVLAGENEFGKSTMFNALQEVLFTSTNLTPALLLKWGKRWFPKPDGDHARVSLFFEAEEKSWQLEKVWGAGRQCFLHEEGANSLADPDRVADKIRSLLKWNEATWTKVLFTRQAELARTIEELSDNLLDKIDDLETRLKGMAAIPGDLPAEQMKNLLDSEIKKQNSHWITDLSLPENGRGTGNPWQKDVGQTLQAYYLMETAREKLEARRKKEDEIQLARDQRSKLEEQVKDDREFCLWAEEISPGLSQRAILESELNLWSQDFENTRIDFREWPVVREEVKSMEALIHRILPETTRLEEELNSARKKEREKVHLTSYQQIVNESNALASIRTMHSDSNKPDGNLISEWENVLKKRENTLIKIGALKLKVSILSKSDLTIRVQEGLNPEKNIELRKNEKWESHAGGFFRLSHQDLELTVENGELDLDTLTTNLRQLEKKEAEIKAALGQDSLEEAVRLLKQWEEKQLDIQQREKILMNLLRDRTKEQWDGWFERYQQLPATREEKALDDELQEKRRELNLNEADLKVKKDRIQQLISRYGDLDKLSDRLLELKAGIQQKKEALQLLPELPEAYQDVTKFLSELQEKQERSRSSEALENKLKEQIIALSAALPEENTADLEADFLLKEKNFLRQKERSRALLRIRKTLDDVLEKREEANPQELLAASISERFKRLSLESYHHIRLGDEMNAEGKTPLPFHTLSRGTLGSLALAIRLSLGELYLKGLGGLLVLDDPFTEMDEGRRAAAIKELSAFSAQHQVLLITCHSAHHQELIHAGAAPISVGSIH